MAYQGSSIVDFLSQSGQASDYGSRAKLAASKGITGYTGSAGQNTQLLNMLRGSSQPSAPTTSNSTPNISIQAPGAQDFNSTVTNALDIYKKANEPIISQLQNSIPDIQKQYSGVQSNLEAQRKPLQDRYDQLLATVKGNQQIAENRQTVTTNNELGKRGILPSSGVSQQELTNALNPITQQYTALGNDVGFQGQQAQQDITSQEAGLSAQQLADIRNVNNAIAQAQATGNTSAIGLAQQQIQAQRELNQQAIQNALAQGQLKVSQANSGIAATSAASENALRNAQIQQMDPEYIAKLYKILGITRANPGQITNLNGGLMDTGTSGASAQFNFSKFLK